MAGEAFKPSNNDYDWLGPGVYFWENNAQRGLEFAREQMARKGSKVKEPFVVGTVIDLGACLDLTTKVSIDLVRVAHAELMEEFAKSGATVPINSKDRMRHNLDCAVIKYAHWIAARDPSIGPIQTVKGVFVEGEPAYPGADFREKTHIQIAVFDSACIKGVFHVPAFR